MHTDARTIGNGTLIEGDICIIGAGPAGISLALEWINTPYTVVLLEGGGFNVEARLQALYQGESVGQPYYPLDASRLHYFGGTTGHWGGYCSRLDPIDFEQRDWIPHSGWPISLEDLIRFYARAQSLPELGPNEYDVAYWETRDPDFIGLPLDKRVIWTKMWQFSPPTRFGTTYRARIVTAPNLHLFTYANVCEIEPNESVTAIRAVGIRTISGKTHRVQARHYIMACGAIDNARLLLASNRKVVEGLGNEHDQVGRYFMEHIQMPGAQLVFAKPTPMKMYTLRPWQAIARGELALSSQAQREHRVLNGTASFRPGRLDTRRGSTFQQLPPRALERQRHLQDQQNIRRSGQPRHRRARTPPSQPAYQLFTRQEQSPNPQSRVTLSEKEDEMGIPLATLNWQLTELDKRSIRIYYQVLGREIGRSGLGRLRVADWLEDQDDGAWPLFLSGAWHHMGTLRMHANPRHGVVDANCKVHGLENLYVAGSAVFPTAGATNPTLTIIALALRLSDHLKGKVG